MSLNSYFKEAYRFEIQFDLIPKSFHGFHVKRASRNCPRIVNHRIHGAEIFLDLLDSGLDKRILGHIASVRLDLFRPLGMTLLLCLGEILDFQVDEREIRPGLGKCNRNGLSDPTTTSYPPLIHEIGVETSYDDDATFEFPGEARGVNGIVNVVVNGGFF